MLEQFPIQATVAASDLDRARTWYREKLGLAPKQEDGGGLWFEFSGQTWLYVYRTPVYRTPSAGTAGTPSQAGPSGGSRRSWRS